MTDPYIKRCREYNKLGKDELIGLLIHTEDKLTYEKNINLWQRFKRLADGKKLTWSWDL